MNETRLVLVEFIDGTSKTMEAHKDPHDGYYGYLSNREMFYVTQDSDYSRAIFPREFVKAISFLDEEQEA